MPTTLSRIVGLRLKTLNHGLEFYGLVLGLGFEITLLLFTSTSLIILDDKSTINQRLQMPVICQFSHTASIRCAVTIHERVVPGTL